MNGTLDLVLALTSIGILLASSLAAALPRRSDRLALVIGVSGNVGGCVVGFAAAVATLLAGRTGSSLRLPWSVPVGEHLRLDPLSAFFLLCLTLVSALAAIFSIGYLGHYAGKRALAPVVALYNLLVASMAATLLAADGVLFLMVWEVMSISSFFLVTFEDEREEVRRAGTTYLIASQAGAVFLFLLFGWLARAGHSLDFEALAAGRLAPAAASAAFLLALVGFGTKAGFWPLHVWLPDAHPAAPSHVSALMSGFMINLGIYGLLRTLTFLGAPPPWWGALLVGAGAVSGIVGVLSALVQRRLKRLLAYSSVENVGLLALGMGIGLLGRSYGRGDIAALGYGGALLHALNHGLFKGLLFEGAGSVQHGTGTRDLEALGGLYRKMPSTALAFLVGSVAIAGLPPLNGFVSEWLLFSGALAGGALPAAGALFAGFAVAALALIGGLASACFVRAFGIVFLGQPRSPAVAEAHEVPLSMRVAMLAGASLCLMIGLWPAAAVTLIAPAVAALAGASLPDLGPSLRAVSLLAAALGGLVLLLAALRARALSGREVRAAPVWGCGYDAPTPRMQYSATSFAEPLLASFAPIVNGELLRDGPDGYFPVHARFEQRFADMAGERLLVPATRRIVSALGKLRVIQQGRIQLYLAYVFATLVLLLLLQLAGWPAH